MMVELSWRFELAAAQTLGSTPSMRRWSNVKSKFVLLDSIFDRFARIDCLAGGVDYANGMLLVAQSIPTVMPSAFGPSDLGGATP